MLQELDLIGNFHLGLIIIAKRSPDLMAGDERPVYFMPHQAGPKVQDFE